MLKWAVVFAVVAVIAGAMGFLSMAGFIADIAKFLFFVALGGFALFLALGVWAGRKLSRR